MFEACTVPRLSRKIGTSRRDTALTVTGIADEGAARAARPLRFQGMKTAAAIATATQTTRASKRGRFRDGRAGASARGFIKHLQYAHVSNTHTCRRPPKDDDCLLRWCTAS